MVIVVKKHIEEIQGKNYFPYAQQLSIHSGKDSKDETTLEDNKFSEDRFLVVMLTRWMNCIADIDPKKKTLQDDTQSVSGEVNVGFQITKDTLDTMLKSMYFIRDQLSDVLPHWVKYQADSYRPMDSRKMIEGLLVRQSVI